MNESNTHCVLIVGPDVHMDDMGGSGEAANRVPAKCSHCTFPDLDYIPDPYVLTKGVSSPAETSPAHFGNFLVRERVRRILEVAVPDACTFHPTIEKKSKKAAPWWLAVPRNALSTSMPKPNSPICSVCEEPRVWCCPMGGVWGPMKSYDSKGTDIFKSAEWYSREDCAEDMFPRASRSFVPPLTWSQWIKKSYLAGVHSQLVAPSHDERWTRLAVNRDLYFSVRLEQLLKRALVKGQLIRLLGFADVKPTPEDEFWIEEKIRLVTEHGLIEAKATPKGEGAAATANKWFKQFLQRKAKENLPKADFTAVVRKHELTLPQAYVDFIVTVGSMDFEDVMENEGFTARILPPEKLDFTGYRRGQVPDLDEEQSQIDGVMFAETEHGDVFVFDVSAKDSDYPVFWYDHEQNSLEPFAPNFAECIKRFSQKN